MRGLKSESCVHGIPEDVRNGRMRQLDPWEYGKMVVDDHNDERWSVERRLQSRGRVQPDGCQ